MNSEITPRTQTLVDLWLASERFAARADQSCGAIHGIGYIEFMVLLQLSQAPAERMRRIDLANAIGRSASGVTRLLRPMEKIGLVERDRSARDARVSLVRLTSSGRRILQDSLKTVDQLAERSLQALNDSRMKALSETLSGLRSQ